MRRLTGFSRALTIGLAVLQVSTPAVASFADSSVASRGAAASHVEDHTRRNCVPVHTDDCALCRVHSLGAPPADRTPDLACAELETGVVASRTDAAPLSHERSLRRSRAPPVA